MTQRLTVAQAIIAFLSNQYVERDGRQPRFFEGCFGIFGHGNVAGIGQALEQDRRLRYYLFRNEQAMVHAAAAFAKATFRMRAMVCTSSIGPGATNMVTGAASRDDKPRACLVAAGRYFCPAQCRAGTCNNWNRRQTQDISVNDCFKPVSRYWDRIQRPEQLLTSLPEAMRVLTSPAETGTVTLCLPQDVQAEAFDFPEEFFRKRVWLVPRSRCDEKSLAACRGMDSCCKSTTDCCGRWRALLRSVEALSNLRQQTGIPVCETQAGKGSLPYRPSATSRRHGSNRHARREYSGPGSGLSHRHRNALQRFHDRFQNCLSESIACAS